MWFNHISKKWDVYVLLTMFIHHLRNAHRGHRQLRFQADISGLEWVLGIDFYLWKSRAPLPAESHLQP